MSEKIHDIGGVAIVAGCAHLLQGACSVCVNEGLTARIRQFAVAAAERVAWVEPQYTTHEVRRQILELAREYFDCNRPRAAAPRET